MECLRVMVQLVACFSKLCAPHLPTALALAWRMYVGALPAYTALAVEGEDEEGEPGRILGGKWRRGGRAGRAWGGVGGRVPCEGAGLGGTRRGGRRIRPE